MFKDYQLTILLLFSCVVSACATVGTEVDFESPRKASLSLEAGSSVTLRAYRVNKDVIGAVDSSSVTVEGSKELSKKVRKILKKLPSISEIKEKTFSSEAIIFDERNIKLKKLILGFPVEGIKTDYFIDFAFEYTNYRGSSFAQVTRTFNLLSLGFLPGYRNIEFKITMTVFGPNGTILKQYSVNDKMRIWRWNFLVFAPDAYFFTSDIKTSEPDLLMGAQALITKYL